MLWAYIGPVLLLYSIPSTYQVLEYSSTSTYLGTSTRVLFKRYTDKYQYSSSTVCSTCTDVRYVLISNTPRFGVSGRSGIDQLELAAANSSKAAEGAVSDEPRENVHNPMFEDDAFSNDDEDEVDDNDAI